MKMPVAIFLVVLIVLFFSCAKKQEDKTSKGLVNGEFTVNLNGFNIFYAVYGQGPILMAMPNSWGLSHEGLRVLYKPLEEHVTMVYFDPRGMGRSDPIREDTDMSMAAVRADLNALRLHLGLDKVNVIGWSNGGMNLLLYAAGHPETLSSAIIVHSIAYVSEEDNEYIQKHFPQLLEKYGEFTKEMAREDLSDEEKDTKYKDFIVNEWFPFFVR